ncbi:hypothetical protein AJ79_05347 [Helicocarpus griseus UAMH5409]|uniref:Aminoglycoside phosphotransferase domain-containing protein n=1 Tax=Helicocarpus griseus UAMH5409 TaxID=1447875 RepID=A0A2B7XPA3_9EURO|nr:hypothetical protein AJ79_05347 [Helicocarpus griseus UAMH5409]
MTKTLPLLHDKITYSVAKEQEGNILHKLGYYRQSIKFFSHLLKNRILIQALAAHHLGLNADACHVSDPGDWLHGSFNVCIPISINQGKRSVNRAMIRFPLPHRIGEAFRPGNADEKLRCEAGAYVWLQENCPTVPIPQLYGFGLSGGQSFTAIENTSLASRFCQYIRRLILGSLGYKLPSRYVRTKCDLLNTLGTGYLLIEYVDEERGSMLSNTWNDRRHDTKLRKNLFRSLSRILLTIAKVPVSTIGSFKIDDNGYLTLSNRPLVCEIQKFENEEIPVEIPRDFTYSNADSYIVDILTFHDSRLSHQLNGATDEKDCIYQMSALTMMKSLFPRFFQRRLRGGPFVFSLTDLHQSNILVDQDWNVTSLIDLEWSCSRPIEMLHPPQWLTSQAIDEINVSDYDKLRIEYMEILKQEEMRFYSKSTISDIMQRGWERGTFWFSLALNSPTGLFSIFYDHIQPRFAKGHIDDKHFFRILMSYWTENTWEFINKKKGHKTDYDQRLREAFEER